MSEAAPSQENQTLSGQESQANPEPQTQAQDPVSAPQVQVAAVSAGQLLRQAREAAGVSIQTLSAALKVPQKKLEALEADDWPSLLDAVFVRALATSVCRQLKIDSAAVLAALPQGSSVLQAHIETKYSTPKVSFQTPVFYSPTASLLTRLARLPLSLPMVGAAVALLLAALVVILLPDFSNKPSEQKEVTAQVTKQPATPLVSQAPAEPVVLSPVPAPSVSMPSVLPSSAASLVAAQPPVAVASSAEPRANRPTLRIATKGQVWVQVKDGKGMILIQRNVQPQEVITVVGSAPLAVVLGRVDEVQSVWVRHQIFDFKSVAAGNIARFEVD